MAKEGFAQDLQAAQVYIMRAPWRNAENPLGGWVARVSPVYNRVIQNYKFLVSCAQFRQNLPVVSQAGVQV